MASAIRSIPFIDIGSYPDFIQLLKICFARTKKEWQGLHLHYEEFKKEYRQSLDSKLSQKPEKSASPLPNESGIKKYQLEDIKKWLFNLRDKEIVETAFYSPFATEDQSFSELDAGDLINLDKWIKLLLQKIANDRRRKKKRNLVKGDLDLKYLMRNRFIKGDELLQLVYRYRKKERTKIVFLCDVSKSMDLHSRFITSLVKQLPQVFDDATVYFFNTELYTINPDEEWKDVSGLWAGGTRIGFCFDQWLHQVPEWFDHKSKVIIYSDGWDTGDLELLDRSMFAMHRLAHKIFWLNPVIKDEYDIQASGMKVAKEHIDVLAPVYNLATLKSFVKAL